MSAVPHVILSGAAMNAAPRVILNMSAAPCVILSGGAMNAVPCVILSGGAQRRSRRISQLEAICEVFS